MLVYKPTDTLCRSYLLFLVLFVGIMTIVSGIGERDGPGDGGSGDRRQQGYRDASCCSTIL